MREIASLGSRAVSLVVHWHQRDVRSSRIARGSLTPSDRAVVSAILDARAAGLEVLVFPIVWVEKRKMGEWRGTLAPRDRDQWWTAYEAFIMHYANLIELANGSWLSVGSELGSTETWRDRWYHLIARVERTTAAALLYSANWDHFELVSFWKRLSAIGINGYFPIASRNDASASDMRKSWAAAKRKLVAATKQIDRPLVLTEVGYLSRDGGAVRPWDYGSSAKVDVEEQRRAYAAFTSIWSSERALAGALFWDWNGAGGRSDRGYTPRGKPAESIARAFFAKRRSKPVR